MPEPLKDRYNPAFIKRLSKVMQNHCADFNAQGFAKAVFQSDWTSLELKQRMRRISTALHGSLPLSYSKQLAVLRKAATEFEGFEAMVFPDFVEQFGLENFEASSSALEWFTRFSSSEFAVRPFIVRYGERMITVLMKWARNENEHVRRLASEGSRPRLPWGMALPAFKKDPRPTLPILELLAQDSSEYVRRSVANHLNDIAKDHPQLLLDLAGRWLGKNQNTNRLVKHACRTLLKRGDPRALKLFGFAAQPSATIGRLSISPKTLCIGGSLRFEFEVHNASSKKQQLRLEYAVDFVKARGVTSRKVFMISEGTFPGGTAKSFVRNHRFCDFTTRTHYPGLHHITILINGIASASTSLLLKPPLQKS
jgi:3-methyladenine DNA glycosylase AlkC